MGELDSYVISYGQDASDLSNTIEINDASTMEYTIDDLSAGEWFFSIQVIDTDGLISAPSDVVSKTI
ncbi:MAG: fibronectin type III domain-containing protein [Marinobacter sp.]|nr:fibronectin type III domain-containing protein [Marinobacter sp.]